MSLASPKRPFEVFGDEGQPRRKLPAGNGVPRSPVLSTSAAFRKEATNQE